jgi:hypothetical protein
MANAKPKSGDKEVKPKAAPKAPAKAKAEPVKVAKAPKVPKAPKPPREEMPKQNDVRRPRPGGKCADVWDTADAMSKQLKRTVSVSELLDTCLKSKTHAHVEANIKTEYARWRKFNGITGRVTAPKAAEAK